jgi:hypothetical protein
MRLLAHLLMKLFVLIVQSSVSYLFEMTIFQKKWVLNACSIVVSETLSPVNSIPKLYRCLEMEFIRGVLCP